MVLTWSSPGLAQRVVLVGPAAPSASNLELLERLRGELSSVGFAVTVSESPAPSESSQAAREPRPLIVARDDNADAAVTLVGDLSSAAVDVWIANRDHVFQTVTRVTVDANTENASKRLAIRVSEVLRARLLEARIGTTRALPPRSSREQRSPPAEPDSKSSVAPRGVGVELGLGMLTSLDGVGPALVPRAALNWEIEPELVLQATFAALGTQPHVTTEAGNALVSTQSALLGASYRFAGAHQLRPLGALSLGVLHTGVTGRTEAPREGHSLEQWSFLLDASLGVAFELSQRYTAVLAGHAQLAQPYVAIRFGDQQVASSGLPNLLLSLSLGVWP